MAQRKKKKERKKHQKGKKHKKQSKDNSSSSENSNSSDEEKRKAKRLKKALKAEVECQKEADRLLAMDERKRPYNSMYEVKGPTEEEMEAYFIKRQRPDDPMAAFLSSR